MVTLTSINGQNVSSTSNKWGRVNGQDVWVAAGMVIPFITCAPGVTCPMAFIPLP